MMSATSDDFSLRVDSLNYAYPGGRIVLRGVSFCVREGEVLGIVGPSGAGKSTLLMHLNGLLPERAPQSGEERITVLGTSLSAQSLKHIRQSVGFVFQNPDDQLFCPTVREDVAFGPLNLGLNATAVAERVQQSLQRVGLSGYEHRSTLQLSVGERKRVCLAGVLACEPKLLVLDEPFANLDPRSRRTLSDILKSFSGSQVIATHDLDLVVELCDRVLVLDGGQIQADGSVESVLADPVLMEQHGLEVPWQLR